MPAKQVAIPRGAPAIGHRIATLDSLRAVVALIVVVHHVWTIFFGEVQTRVSGVALAIWDVVQAQNHRAVMAFFVLSGFTIALTTDGQPPVHGPAARSYLWRRLRRIVPLFYLSLACTAALGAIYGYPGHQFSWRTLAGNLLFLQTSLSAAGTWFAPFGANGPYWSLSYEMTYYLALPLALLTAGGQKGVTLPVRLRLVAIGFVALLAGLGMLQITPNPFAYFAAAWIVWIAGFVAHGLASERRSLILLALPALGCWALTGGLALAGHSSDTLVGAVEGTTLALFFGVLVTWRGWTRFGVVRAFDRAFNAMFARIGQGSYALYLLHYPLLLALYRVLVDGRAGMGGWVVAVLLLVLFVILFCPWIERTSLALFQPRAMRRGVPA